MKTKAELIAFVKDQTGFHRRQAHSKEKSGDQERAARHARFAQDFADLKVFLEEIPDDAQKPGRTDPPGFLRIGDIDELPEELRMQIKISESDKVDMDIIEAIDGFGGTAAIDEILVALWRKSDKIHERDYIARKIYRLTRNDMLRSVKRKGYFTTDLSQENEDPDDEPDQDSIVSQHV